MNHEALRAAKSAFPATIPILAGFTFLGITYGIYMNVLGFSPLYPIVMSMLIFAGSVEFITGNLLLGAFDPIGAFVLVLLANARHTFYGLSMLEKYNNTGWKKPYLIFGMCDESFSINYTAEIPEDVDASWYYFFVTLYNQIYWVMGASLGALFGSMIQFNTQGLEFVMTALFLVIFLEHWLKGKDHVSAGIGLLLPLIALIVFGSERFMMPAMIGILIALTGLRGKLEERETQ